MIQPALLAAPLGNSNALKTQLPAARFGPQAVCYFCDCGALWVTESDVKLLSPAAGDTTPKRIVSRRRRTMSPSMGPPCSDIPDHFAQVREVLLWFSPLPPHVVVGN